MCRSRRLLGFAVFAFLLPGCSRTNWQNDWGAFVSLVESKVGKEAPITYGAAFDKKTVEWQGKIQKIECPDDKCKVFLQMSPSTVTGEGKAFEVGFVVIPDAATLAELRRRPPGADIRFGVTLNMPGMMCITANDDRRIALVVSENFRLL